MEESVPQGGVFSPTLFPVLFNDIMTDFQKKINVENVMYVDDLMMCSAEE